jgi:hypothetical protein
MKRIEQSYYDPKTNQMILELDDHTEHVVDLSPLFFLAPDEVPEAEEK